MIRTKTLVGGYVPLIRIRTTKACPSLRRRVVTTYVQMHYGRLILSLFMIPLVAAYLRTLACGKDKTFYFGSLSNCGVKLVVTALAVLQIAYLMRKNVIKSSNLNDLRV